jgi:transposase
MIRLELGAARIFVRPGATDMRKQINGLVLLVQEQMQLSPFEAALFVFCNAQRRVLKAVYWDRTGFCLWCKRLEKGRFPWPPTAAEARREIDVKQLRMLLIGIDFWQEHEELRYREIA